MPFNKETYNKEYRKEYNKRLEYKEMRKEYDKKYLQRIRLETLFAYGGRCVCCGYDNINKKIHGKAFLQIDHINGKNKENNKTGNGFYIWLKNHNFPDKFRVLCRGCNCSMEYGQLKCEIHKEVRNQIERI